MFWMPSAGIWNLTVTGLAVLQRLDIVTVNVEALEISGSWRIAEFSNRQNR